MQKLPIKSFLNTFQGNTPDDFQKLVNEQKRAFWSYSKLTDKIQSLNNFKKELEIFVTTKEWRQVSSIAIDEIIGTDHNRYIDMSYYEMLGFGIKMDVNIPLLLSNPNYYYEVDPKEPTAYYATFNTRAGDSIAFVDGDGNHRTCLAKVIRAYDENYQELHGITKTSYEIDYGLYDQFVRIKETLEPYGYIVSVDKFDDRVEEDKSGAWIKWYFTHNIEISKKGKRTVLKNAYDFDERDFLPLSTIMLRSFKKVLNKL